MIENNISPKRIQFIYPKENVDSNMLIIEGTKNGNNSLKVLNPLIIHKENGDYKDNIKEIFKLFIINMSSAVSDEFWNYDGFWIGE